MTRKEARVSIDDNEKAVILFGSNDENFKYLKSISNVDMFSRGGDILLSGEEEQVNAACELLRSLIDMVETEGQLTINDINYLNGLMAKGAKVRAQEVVSGPLLTTVRGKVIKAKTLGQKRYVQSIIRDDIVFGIGPAGTGKTYLAVVMAVRALKNKEVERIILVRPAVEAGEKLGFCRET